MARQTVESRRQDLTSRAGNPRAFKLASCMMVVQSRSYECVGELQKSHITDRRKEKLRCLRETQGLDAKAEKRLVGGMIDPMELVDKQCRLSNAHGRASEEQLH